MILGLQVIKNLDFAQQVDDAEETQADYSHELLFDAPDAVYWNGTQSQSYQIFSGLCKHRLVLPRQGFSTQIHFFWLLVCLCSTPIQDFIKVTWKPNGGPSYRLDLATKWVYGIYLDL